MRAALCAAYGGPEVIAVTDIEPPTLAAGEVSEQSLARWVRDNWPKP